MAKQSKSFVDQERYRKLLGKLIYLTITRLDLPFAVGVISQFCRLLTLITGMSSFASSNTSKRL